MRKFKKMTLVYQFGVIVNMYSRLVLKTKQLYLRQNKRQDSHQIMLGIKIQNQKARFTQRLKNPTI